MVERLQEVSRFKPSIVEWSRVMVLFVFFEMASIRESTRSFWSFLSQVLGPQIPRYPPRPPSMNLWRTQRQFVEFLMHQPWLPRALINFPEWRRVLAASSTEDGSKPVNLFISAWQSSESFCVWFCASANKTSKPKISGSWVRMKSQNESVALKAI